MASTRVRPMDEAALAEPRQANAAHLAGYERRRRQAEQRKAAHDQS